MGLLSVLALLHDAFIIITIFSLFKIEVDLIFIAAMLTVVGYSINGTIVTSDRVRESLREVKVITATGQIDGTINRPIKQTMARSINTVLIVIVVVVAMLFLGAPTILNFTLTSFIELISDVFSSVFIAVPF